MTSKIKICPVILCGGQGSRLWPLSRASFPKQFLNLIEGETLFQRAVRLCSKLDFNLYKASNLSVVTNEEYRFLVTNQISELSLDLKAKVFLEPEGRNTSAALTLAALDILANDPDAIMIVTPSDHYIENENEFILKVSEAIHEANNESLVIFGALPTEPKIGYGYISYSGSENLKDVISFTEKPTEDLAKSFLNTGSYLWNCGILIVKAAVWLKNIHLCNQEIYNLTNVSYSNSIVDGDFIRPSIEDYKLIPNISIDYAVLEPALIKKIKLKMIQLDAGWSDLGDWESISNLFPKDEFKNSSYGDVIHLNSDNNFIYSNSRLVAAVGVKNLFVIETSDALLIADKSMSQSIKTLVSRLADSDRKEVLIPRKEYRPWGWFDTIESGAMFKVKRICVKPKSSLSLQKHSHRSEHWIVIKGEAKVICGDNSFILKSNESTFIPRGTIHQLINNKNSDLELIEVQAGDYLGEDDIIRIKDEYGR